MKLSVVVPVYNERRFVGEILERIEAVEMDKEIVVVDDGSTDGTTQFLREMAETHRFRSARFIFKEKNAGKGAALRTGIEAARGDIVIIQDADLEYDPVEYPRLIEPIVSGKADVVFGSRFLSGPHRVLFFWHSVGNQTLTLFSNMMTNLNLTDMETGYKVFRRDIFDKITIEENRFGFEPEITAKVAKLRCRVYEIPIAYHGRDYSEGKKITWRDGFAALYCIVKYNLLRSSRLPSSMRMLGLISLLVITFFNVIDLRQKIGPLQPSADDTVSYDQRLQELRRLLPRTGQVGYLTDGDPLDGIRNPGPNKVYYMTQYALVPLVVRPGTEGQIIIGNFMDPQSAAIQTTGLKLVKDLGGGLMLLRKDD
jgi:glycosyltransferase involved in cell wall biosynthesis